ncbi:hypothetical protein [Actinomadura madurae]|uniref:hypothetical protein n=1 Tax=Actinomadura madurae TaxID=1993 RepID=UPI0027E239B1|nr:hypothetical protein [Actinomadura madurae]
MIEGEVEVLEIDALPRERADRFAARTGFDPRDEATPYRWFRVTPRRVQAWREADELPGRELMRDGRRAGLTARTLGPGPIGPGDAEGGRAGGPAERMETR